MTHYVFASPPTFKVKIGDTWSAGMESTPYTWDGSMWVAGHMLTMDQMPPSSHYILEPQTAARVFTYRETAAMHIMAALATRHAWEHVDDPAREAVRYADALIKALQPAKDD